MKAPLKRVWIAYNNRDISDFVESINLKEIIDKDNQYTIKIHSEHSKALADDDDLIRGRIIELEFGFIEGPLSRRKRARITNRQVTYGKTVSLTFKALDLGSVMKKGGEQFVFKNKTASEIAEQVALKHGLGMQIDKTDKVYKSYTQGNKTDYEMMLELAKLEKETYEFYVLDDKLYFVKREAPKYSYVRFDYGHERVIKATISETESSDKGNTTATDVDPETLETKEKQGLFWNWIDPDGKFRYRTYEGVEGQYTHPDMSDYIKSGQDVPMPMPDADAQEETENALTQKNKDTKMRVNKLVLETEGNPYVRVGQVIVLDNVARRDGGNWYVHEAEHDVNNSYILILTCGRTAYPQDSLADNAKEKPNDEKDEKNPLKWLIITPDGEVSGEGYNDDPDDYSRYTVTKPEEIKKIDKDPNIDDK